MVRQNEPTDSWLSCASFISISTTRPRAGARVCRWGDKRSFVPSDIRGEQTAVLADVVPAIAHPALRARAADTVWSNDRSRGSAAAIAVDAYCELIGARLDGLYASRFERVEDSVMDAVTWFRRVLQIVAFTRKRDDVPAIVGEVFAKLYERTLSTGQYTSFVKLASAGLEWDFAHGEEIARDAEQLAENRAGGDYPMAVQPVWDLAARCHARIGDKETEKRCRLRSVDETLRMREQNPQRLAQASWTRKAIAELRSIGGTRSRVEELRAELRGLQEASLEDFAAFSIPLDLTEQRQGTVEVFEGLTLPDILLQFACLSRSPSIEELRQQALDSRKEGFFSSLFGSTYTDDEGKVVAQTPALPLDAEPDDDWIKAQSLQYLDIWRAQVVSGAIEPARRTVLMRFPLEERHFEPIVGMSPFVPPGHEPIFALGFARFWQGDAITAAHLLIPQLENSLRFVLLTAKRDSSKMSPALLQEDRSLSGLLTTLRVELAEIFGPDLVNEIELLFSFKPGPTLRHDMAHGKMTAGACHHRTSLYVCWLIYHLTCLPLMDHWNDKVAPAVEEIAF